MRCLLAACGVLALGLFAADRAFPPSLARYQARAIAVAASDGAPLDVEIAPDGFWRLPATVADISPFYLRLLVETEDKRFYEHPGVDPLALLRAAFQVAVRGHVVSGGSTLTMQVARLLAPHRHDLLGKLEDIARALQLERRYSKAKILSMYLTLAPCGGNIEGVEAASLAYFGNRPASLTPAEAALLVALPRQPRALDPLRHRSAAEAAARMVLARAGEAETWGRGLAGLHRHPWPRLAPHLAEKLRAEGHNGFVATTLDEAIQRTADALIARRIRPLGGQANAAVLIVRNRDRAVLAYIGSTDFFAPHGMVDMTNRRRSPGSALKPFVYGLALDSALIVPDTLMEDAPARFGAWTPHDFDRGSRGAVTAAFALQQSLNLPAVALMRAVGPGRVLAVLQGAGAHLALPAGAAPSLAIVLGGVGIDLTDLAMLYTGLATDGTSAALRILPGDRFPPAGQLMSADAAATVGEILRAAPVPDGISPERGRPIAYKTGTSYGFRDAWAAGFSADYTIAVWTGRTDGTPRPHQFGREAAAPLLYVLFDTLPPDAHAPRRPPPEPPLSSLAPALRRFEDSQLLAAAIAPRPAILFPPDGAVLDATEAGGPPMPIGLHAGGGAPPYRWFVNGVPLPPPPLGLTLNWSPADPGFDTLSVVDRSGNSATVHVRVQ